MECATPDEIAVCNLASICLPKFVKTNKDGVKYFDFDELEHITKIVTRNLNKVIDVNYYPVEEAKRSNMKHRPIGIGIQGLCDVFCLLGLQIAPCEAVIQKGNNMSHVVACLDIVKKAVGNGKPKVILMKTEMGYGVDFMMGSHKWHGVAPNDEQCKIALNQLEETLGDFKI